MIYRNYLMPEQHCGLGYKSPSGIRQESGDDSFQNCSHFIISYRIEHSLTKNGEWRIYKCEYINSAPATLFDAMRCDAMGKTERVSDSRDDTYIIWVLLNLPLN